MFESLSPAPPDAILGLTVAFNEDPNPIKINLGVGVFKDADGKTPILKSVRTAEERILLTEQTKSYLPIDGGPAYNSATQKLLFGEAAPDRARRPGCDRADAGRNWGSARCRGLHRQDHRRMRPSGSAIPRGPTTLASSHRRV